MREITDKDRMDFIQIYTTASEIDEEVTEFVFLKDTPVREQIDDFINAHLGGIEVKDL